MSRKLLSLGTVALAALALLAAPAAHAGLVGWWTFDNTLNDSGPLGNHGTYRQGATPGGTPVYTSDRVGNPNAAISLDGVDDNVLVGITGRPSNNFTFAGWMRTANTHEIDPQSNTTTTGTSGQRYAFWPSHGGATEAGAGLSYGTNGISVYEHGDSYMPPTAVYSSTGVGSGWNHVAIVYNSRTPTIYLNGAAVHTGLTSARNTVRAPIQIGGGDYGYLGGQMDDAAVWNNILSPVDIRNLANGTISPNQASETAPVTYRITVSSPTTDARLAAFIHDQQQGLGVPFYVRSGWTPGNPPSWYQDSGASKTITASGTLTMRTSIGGTVTDWLQIAAAHGAGIGNQTEHPYMAATFTAPAYHVFDFGGGNRSQVLTTNTTTWMAGSVPFNDTSGYPDNVSMYQVPSPNPAVTSPPFAPGTQALWARATGFPGNPYTDVYFATEAKLVPGNWPIAGSPEPLPGDSVPGLSGLFVRRSASGALGSLDAADATLLLRRGAAGHDMSTARTRTNPLSVAHIDLLGDFATGHAGVLAGWRDAGGTVEPLNIATMLAGYVRIPALASPTGYSFAVFGDDDAYMRIGATEWTRGSGRQVNTVVFPASAADTYWPILVVSRNASGGTGLEVSSAPATWDAGLGMWVHPGYPGVTMGSFSILGASGSLSVFTRDAALGSLAGIGGESAGAPTFPGTFPGAATSGDGVWINAQGALGTGMTTTTAAINWFATNPDGGTRERRTVINIADTGAAGAFPANERYPGMPTGANDYIAFRSRALFYSPGGETVGFAVGTDDGFRLQLGNRIVGNFDGGRGMPTDQNMMYAYFDQPGFYRMELYHHEGTGDAGIEMSYKVGATLLDSSRNPNTAGYTLNLANRFHTFRPRVEFAQVDGLEMWGKAWVELPAVTGPGSYFAPDSWVLHRLVTGGPARIAGLLGTYYDLAMNQTVTNVWTEGPVLGTRSDVTSGSFYLTSGFPSPLVPSRPGSPTNPAGANDHFAVKWTGYLNVPVTGLYSFQCRNDDRGWMFIDVDGNGAIDPVTEGMPGQPQTWDVWRQWNNVFLTQGLHAIDFRMREWAGGEEARFQWMLPGAASWADIPATVLSQNIFDGALVPIAYGIGSLLGTEVGGLLEMAHMATFPMDWDNYVTLRLTAEFFGLTAITEGTFRFVPEPGTMVLLAGGLLAVVQRRRRQRTQPRSR